MSAPAMSLLLVSCPAAIVWLVIAFTIRPTINRQMIGIAIRQSPIAKIIVARPVNDNTTTTIASKRTTMGIAAPCQHAGPDAMKTRSHASSGIAMRGKVKFRPFHPEASTGFDFSFSQQFPLRNMLVAAFATASPQCALIAAAGGSDHRQSPENLSRDINRSGHVNLLRRFAGQVTEPTCKLAPLRILADFRR